MTERCSVCSRLRVWAPVGLVASVAFLCMLGCSTTRLKEKADRETYKIVEEKGAQVPGMEPEFSAEPAALSGEWESLPKVQTADDTLGPAGEFKVGAGMLSLEQALRLAFTYNRTYQNRKEALYLQALELTLQRHAYAPIFGASNTIEYTRSTKESSRPSKFSEGITTTNDLIRAIEQVSGRPADLLRQYAQVVEDAGALVRVDEPRTVVSENRSVSGEASVSVQKLLAGGGRLAVQVTSNFLKFLTGAEDFTSGSTLGVSFTQPLLRGAGRTVAREALTQAERDTLYAVRDLVRFRQEFVVDITRSFYQVLQAEDTVRNAWQSVLSFRRAAERQRALAEEGRKTPAESGRLEQAALQAESRYAEAARRYRELLDAFKVSLGLPTTVHLVLDTNELTKLRREGLLHPNFTMEDAETVALVARVDAYNARDRVSDAERKVTVAENALLPELALGANLSLSSAKSNGFGDIDLNRARWSALLDTDYGLNRKPRRNAYRVALIQKERAVRELSLTEDQIRLAVRSAYRDLEQAKTNYDIASQAVNLNQRRVEEQELLASLGRATALNQVDALNDLTRSQNDLTAALINHTLARLSLWRDMGILYVKKDGRWEEIQDERGPTTLHDIVHAP